MTTTRFTMTSQQARTEAIYQLTTTHRVCGFVVAADDTCDRYDIVVEYRVHHADVMERVIQSVDPDASESVRDL